MDTYTHAGPTHSLPIPHWFQLSQTPSTPLLPLLPLTVQESSQPLTKSVAQAGASPVGYERGMLESESLCERITIQCELVAPASNQCPGVWSGSQPEGSKATLSSTHPPLAARCLADPTRLGAASINCTRAPPPRATAAPRALFLTVPLDTTAIT